MKTKTSQRENLRIDTTQIRYRHVYNSIYRYSDIGDRVQEKTDRRIPSNA